ncbi:MAG: hypothetical protein J3K34DRAFT_516134 [Monoraphidium minutum]|nr:MAG: hypothetical protein J3K34DRAFT_516134 [Monoraphidium minutum]
MTENGKLETVDQNASLQGQAAGTARQKSASGAAGAPGGDAAFLSFIADTVLNSYDGGEPPPDVAELLRAANAGRQNSLIDLARSGSALGAAGMSVDFPADGRGAAAAGAAAAQDEQRPAAPVEQDAGQEEGEEQQQGDANEAGAAAAGGGGGQQGDAEMNEAPPADAGAAAAAAAAPPASRKRTRATAAAGAAPPAGASNDAAAAPAPERSSGSADTMPMPAKRRRGGGGGDDDAEVTSPGGPNDLVELPMEGQSAPPGGAAGGSGAAAKRGAAEAKEAAAAGGGGGRPPAVFKAVLVAKVLTKSDASSKRIILPRIAIEANLPQLTQPGGGGAHGQGRALHFDAGDEEGRQWALCIKAWANGQNPKPVFVLEGGVGELIKSHRLGPGDVVGVLKSLDGRYYVHWNTDQVREAAARPTFCAFEFAKHAEEAKEAAAAKEAREKGAREKADKAAAEAAAAAKEEADAADAAAAAAGAEGGGGGGAAARRPPPPPPPPPPQLMTAVPVTSTPLVPGMFTPTSPCEMLVMGPAPPGPSDGGDGGDDGCADEGGGGGPPALHGARLDAQSSALLEFADPAVAAAIATVHAAQAAAEAAAEIEADDAEAEAAAAARPMERVGGIVHQGGALMCPRTAGCTRPAGHQGWCVGHKGQGTKRR